MAAVLELFEVAPLGGAAAEFAPKLDEVVQGGLAVYPAASDAWIAHQAADDQGESIGSGAKGQGNEVGVAE